MMDEESRMERYLRLNGKFLRDADELMAKGDHVQASEKFWGAAAEAVKAVAENMGRKTRTHADLWLLVEELDSKRPDLGLLEDFLLANHLHSNFYEDELRPSAVRAAAEGVKRFIRKIETFLVS